MKRNPSNLKYKKYHKVNISYRSLIDRKNFFLIRGAYGLQALHAGTLTWQQIEACRRALRRGLKKKGAIYIRPFTSAPISRKSVASRMGKGKGAISHWVSPIKAGQIMFEINCKSEVIALNTLKKAATKLPIKVKIRKLTF